jgi:hypothetical protein
MIYLTARMPQKKIDKYSTIQTEDNTMFISSNISIIDKSILDFYKFEDLL